VWNRLYNAAVAEGIQISGHFRKPDAAIYWLCVCRRTMTESGNRSALGRTDASASCFSDGCSWRKLRLQPKTAFLRFPAVHRADLEGQQRVDLTRSPRRRECRLFARSGRLESTSSGLSRS